MFVFFPQQYRGSAHCCIRLPHNLQPLPRISFFRFHGFEKNGELVNTYIRIIREENNKNKEMIENVLNIVRNEKKMEAVDGWSGYVKGFI